MAASLPALLSGVSGIAFNKRYLLAADRDALIQQARDSDVLCTAFDASTPPKCIDPAP